jgi:hypothetical protein
MDEIAGVFLWEKVWLENSQTFSRINTPTISSWLVLLLTLPMKVEQTVFRNIGT